MSEHHHRFPFDCAGPEGFPCEHPAAHGVVITEDSSRYAKQMLKLHNVGRHSKVAKPKIQKSQK